MARRFQGFERLNESIGIATGFVILAMTLLITASVVLRYGVRSPIEWSFEMSEYMLLFTAFPPAAYVLLIDGHIRVDLLVLRLSQRIQLGVTQVVNILALVYSSVLLWQTIKYAHRAYVMDWHSTSERSVYLFPIIVWMPIAMSLLCLACLFRIYRSLVR